MNIIYHIYIFIKESLRFYMNYTKKYLFIISFLFLVLLTGVQFFANFLLSEWTNETSAKKNLDSNGRYLLFYIILVLIMCSYYFDILLLDLYLLYASMVDTLQIFFKFIKK